MDPLSAIRKGSNALSAGWAPHRDRSEASQREDKGFRADETPKYTTVWVALSEANHENSCLSVIPKGVDPGYTDGDGEINPLSVIFSKIEAFQEIRSLPCKPGGLICFSHRLMHWGSKPDPHSGAPPRAALSFAAASNDFEKPYLDRKHLPVPPLELRVALVCGQILAYSGNVDPGEAATKEYFGIFKSLAGEFEPDFVDKVVTQTKWLAVKHQVTDYTKADIPERSLNLNLGVLVKTKTHALVGEDPYKTDCMGRKKNITIEEQRAMIEGTRPKWLAEQRAKELAAPQNNDEIPL